MQFFFFTLLGLGDGFYFGLRGRGGLNLTSVIDHFGCWTLVVTHQPGPSKVNAHVLASPFMSAT